MREKNKRHHHFFLFSKILQIHGPNAYILTSHFTCRGDPPRSKLKPKKVFKNGENKSYITERRNGRKRERKKTVAWIKTNGRESMEEADWKYPERDTERGRKELVGERGGERKRKIM